MNNIDADALRDRLDAHNYRHIFRKLGFETSGERGTKLTGILGPRELGEGEVGNFSVDLEEGFVRDFGSSKYRGDVFNVVQDVLDRSFPEAVQWIAEEVGLDEETLQTEREVNHRGSSADGRSEPSEPSTNSSSSPGPVVSHDRVSDWHDRLMASGEAANAARSYLEGRCVSNDVMKTANLGLAHSSGDNRAEWWIMIPVLRRDLEDAPVVSVKGFGFDPETGDWKQNDDGRKIPRNAGSAALLNLIGMARDAGSSVVVCEGELDALSACACGFHAVSGTAGAGTFNQDWARRIAETKPAQEHGVVIAFDGDEKGRRSAPDVAEAFLDADLELKIASLPDGKDVNDVLVEGGSADLHAYLARAEPYEPAPELEVSDPAPSSDSSEEPSREYEPFPLDTLPGPVEEYVRASTHALGHDMPPAMVGVPTLSVLAGAVGNSAKLQLKKSWTELPTLWCAIVAPSGSTKSPAFDHALRLIYKREHEAKEQYERDLEAWEDQDDRDHDNKPTRDRFRTGDATPEAVVKILEDNPRGVLLARDEIGAWIGSFDRYVNGAADLQFWIEVWGGIQASRDRVGDGNVTISNPVVPVTGTIQPGTLKEKLGEIHFDTGFASRLILCQPPTCPKRWTEADVSREVRRRYEHLLDGLYSRSVDEEIPLSPGAKEQWIEYYNSENASLDDRPEGPLRAVAAKGVTHAARLALVLHRARQECGEVQKLSEETVPVGPETMEDALQLGKWLKEETLRVYQKHNLGAEASSPILRFLDKLPEEFKTAEAKQIAEDDEIPERTCEKWLTDLLEAGDLDRIKRGLYRKV